MANLLDTPLENIQYVSDADGKPVSVIVPIEVWRDLESECETASLLKSETMGRRLLEAKNRQEQGNRAKFEQALSKVSDAPPDAHDSLQEQNPMSETELEKFIVPVGEYPIWAPHGSYGAAQKLLDALAAEAIRDEESRK